MGNMEHETPESDAEMEPLVAAFTYLYWHRAEESGPPAQVQIALRGETVPSRYMTALFRIVFADALYRLVPTVTDDLLTPDALALRDEWLETSIEQIEGIRGDSSPDRILKLLRDGSLETALEIINDASERYHRYVQEWQARHGLNDDWITHAALTTIEFAEAAERMGVRYIGMLAAIDLEAKLHEGLFDPGFVDPEELMCPPWECPPAKPSTPEHKFTMVPIYLDNLKHPDLEQEHRVLGDNGPFATFDPRTESIGHATDRLLESLRPRVRRALEAIAARDRELNGAQAPVPFRRATAYEWLVRYQVLGESRNGIARSIGADRAHVGREINRAAAMIGLTLRKETGGRPRKRVR